MDGLKDEREQIATGASLSGISEEDMVVYKAAARHRLVQDEKELLVRRNKAWETARRAAKLLKEDFGAQRVVVFGSLLCPECFNKWSDVDIAAWGIGPKDTFRAMGAVMDLREDIEINLVDIETCRATLRTIIEREGQEI
ncbi:MAG: hypothetical protein DDT18_00042 [Actinobacteria bacterium]|nr:hypothetical protein [Actinomycetota bacterium]